METDYLVVGTGLTGATIARRLTDCGEKVIMIDRRLHVGGNVHDEWREGNIRVHTYGPHYFRTSSEKIWKFVRRFANFYKYEPVLMSDIGGKLEHWPIQHEYIKREVGENWKPAFVGNPSNFEEASLGIMPKIIYDKFIHDYNVKQWGVDPRALESSLSGRFEVRTDGDERLKTSAYQGIPEFGYTRFMSNLINGIEVHLGVDFKTFKNAIDVKKRIIYTGPIDELFDFDIGKLSYRGQKRIDKYFPNIDEYQKVGQINTPGLDQGPQVRILEWKHMMSPEERIETIGTIITMEIPYSPSNPNDYEYPFPSSTNRELFKKYQARLNSAQEILVCGRLGEYRYYDMDQAIGRALMLVDKILIPGVDGPRAIAILKNS